MRWLLPGVMLACWPVWIWFAKGVADQSNDASCLLAVAIALVVVMRAPAQRFPALALAMPAMALALYLLAVLGEASQAICAVLAVLALASLASALHLGRRCDLAFVTLCMLALPLTASLQFYLGYPLRVLAGMLTVLMLKMNGIAVLREGATLAWDGRLIAIDAPCSGVRMLWTGLFLAAALAALTGMTARRTAAALLAAGTLVVLANAVRAAALFHVESGTVALPPWAHEAVGMLCFVAAALAILACTQAIRRHP